MIGYYGPSPRTHQYKYDANALTPVSVFSYKLRYIVGFWLVEMAISTNQKPTIYRNLYENTATVPGIPTGSNVHPIRTLWPQYCRLNSLGVLKNPNGKES